MINLYNMDCMELLKNTPDKYYDLAIVDPPYGIDIAEWDTKEHIPTIEYFTELFRVSKNQIIWGGNYFTNNLPISRGWVCWDKSCIEAGYLGKKEYDQFELAWTSFVSKSKMVRFSDIGNMSGFCGKINVDYSFKGKIHPTQKHLQLYKWLLKNYAKEGDKILDTHCGSGSIMLACHDMGFDLDATELDTDYYNAALKRYTDHIKQLKLL